MKFICGPTITDPLDQDHAQVFESIYQCLFPDLRKAIDELLAVSDGDQRSYFYQLKEYPSAVKISSLRIYLKRYQTLLEHDQNQRDRRKPSPARRRD